MKAHLRLLLLFAAVAVLPVGLVACSGDDDDATPQPDASATVPGESTGVATAPSPDGTEPAGETVEGETDAPDGNGCTVTITGDGAESWRSSGDPAAIATDYWLTEEAKREIIRIFAGMSGSELSDEELDATVEAAIASGEPVLGALLLNCTRADGVKGLTFLTSADATEDDIPFGPGIYAVVDGDATDVTPARDSISAFVALGDGAESAWGVIPGGAFTIMHWDAAAIEGTFAFDAQDRFPEEGEEPRTIHVEGAFSFSCQPENGCG